MLKDFENNNQLKDFFIQGWYIDLNVCDNILQQFKKSHQNKNTNKAENPRNYYYNLLVSNEYPQKLAINYINEIKKCYQRYVSTYNIFLNPVDRPQLLKFINVQYFEPFLHYSVFHSERMGHNENVFKTLVFITYLNDVFEDGETDFYFQKIKIKPKKGLTIIWPTEWTHKHRGISTPEDKYIVTGWFEYVENKNLYLDLNNSDINFLQFY